MIWIQLGFLLAMILIGARMKGIGLGVMGMVGMMVFVLVFKMKPAEPPLDVMLIIIALVTTAATLQAAGGLDYLVGIAEKIIRRNPAWIIFIAPFTSYFLCLFAGTSHVIYSLLPIIAEVSAKRRIRPERPLSISVIASHLALTGSPMSAATAALAGILAYPRAAVDIMKIGIPSALIGLLAGAASVWKMGKDLEKDPVFIEKMKDPVFAASIDQTGQKSSALKPGAKTAVLLFGIAIFLVVLVAAFPGLLPNFGPGDASLSLAANGSLKTPAVIEIITLSTAAVIILVTKTSPLKVTQSSLFTAMGTAVVAVFGVVWMSATFMDHNGIVIKNMLGTMVQDYPWTFAIAAFIMGVLMFSQAAATRAMMPLGLTLGIGSPHLIAMFHAVNSDFVLPGYPTLLAAINFDRTGSTKIGKWLLNHSFIRPGLVTIVTAIIAGFILAGILL